MRTRREVEKAKELEEEQDSRRRRIITRLRESLISHCCTLDPSAVDRRLGELFSGGFCTPTHPPYAFMINNAVLGMKEEGGSTKEAISKFIKSEYSGLPWAHESILDMHLRKLCQAGELADQGGRYVVKEEKAQAQAQAQAQAHVQAQAPAHVQVQAHTHAQDHAQAETGDGDEGMGRLGFGVTRPRILNVYTRKRNTKDVNADVVNEAEAKQDEDPTMNQEEKSPNLMVQADGIQKDVMLGLGLGVARPRILKVYTRKRNNKGRGDGS